MYDAMTSLMELEREYDERMAPVATLAEAHADWHAVHGKYAVCDLDCGASEGLFDEDHSMDGDVKCGHCGQYGVSVEHVRACAANFYALKG